MYNRLNLSKLNRLVSKSKNPEPFIQTFENLKNLDSFISLKNKDFEKGTLRIKEPGVYILAEDIVFHPNPLNDCQPLPEQQEYPTISGSPYTLGFFAAIAIETHGVIIDLNGYQIKQSFEHYVHQRFFALIELASSPFFTRQGPASFDNQVNKFKNGCDILITNGTIGFSSHHGIHANSATNVILDNLNFIDFEVAGIALNGSKNVIINNVTIKNNLQKVPLNAKYSQSRFLRRHLKRVYDLTLNKKTAQKLLTEIENTINVAKKQTIRYFKHNTPLKNIPEIFRNEEILGDGAVYGIVLHQNGVVIGPFLKERNINKGNCNIILENVTIQNLKSKPKEIVGINRDGNNTKTYSGKVMTGPVGDVFDILFNTDLNCNYNQNILADAQTFIAKCDLNNDKNSGTTSISQKIIDWVEGKITLTDSIQKRPVSCLVFGGDSMAHAMKGNIGLFISGGKDFYLNNVCVSDIKNFSKDIGTIPKKAKIIYEKLTYPKSLTPDGITDLGGKDYNTLLVASENINFSNHKGGFEVINQ
jgi:hypothetical protein